MTTRSTCDLSLVDTDAPATAADGVALLLLLLLLLLLTPPPALSDDILRIRDFFILIEVSLVLFFS
jgi:hypothetical protein